MHIDFNLPKDLYSQYFSVEFVGEEYLTPKEKEFIKSAVPKRKYDFSTGRFCARKALANLEERDCEILKGEKNEPIWPENICGSISHSKGLTGAVVAKKNNYKSLGLDIEETGRIKDEMWYMLFTENEQKYLKSLEIKERKIASTAIFCMKESFYKFQYPLTKKYLDFTDAEICFQNNNSPEIEIINKEFNRNQLPENITFDNVQLGNYFISLCY